MSRLSTLAALLLAALWLPATLHCQLEGAGLGDLFSCVDHSEHAAQTGCDDCTDSVCQTVESGQFVLIKQRVTITQPAAQLCLYHLCLLALNRPEPVSEPTWTSPDASPPWQSTWHLVRRAALPARAPSLLA